MSLKLVIFAGGGTGGHIFPAIAILEHLRDHDPALHARFLCSTRDIDRRILEPRGLKFAPIAASPFSLRPGPLVGFVRTWPAAVGACTDAIRAAFAEAACGPGEAVLVATGGFVSAPAFSAARKLGVRTVLVNLDAVPGKANRLLASKADEVFSTYDALEAEVVGPIVRREARRSQPPQSCRQRFGLEPDRKTLLVTGASQGAESLNRFVPELVRQQAHAFEDWQILHQAGPDRAADVRRAYESLPVRAEVVELVDDVGNLWGAADLALARAGAGTVAEAWINHIPSAFLPYPYHRDEHQRYNARPLADAGAALILKDHIDPASNVQAHGERLVSLLTGSRELLDMRSQYAQFPMQDGGQAVALKLRNR